MPPSLLNLFLPFLSLVFPSSPFSPLTSATSILLLYIHLLSPPSHLSLSFSSSSSSFSSFTTWFSLNERHTAASKHRHPSPTQFAAPEFQPFPTNTVGAQRSAPTPPPSHTATEANDSSLFSPLPLTPAFANSDTPLCIFEIVWVLQILCFYAVILMVIQLDLCDLAGILNNSLY